MIQEVIMPKLGQTMEEGTINKWVKKEGESVKKGEILLEITTDKATLEVESYAAGILKKIIAKEGEVVPVTQVIAYIGDKDDVVPEVAPSMIQKVAEKTEPVTEKYVPSSRLEEVTATKTEGVKAISPRARRLAREKGVDIDEVVGTGPEGRIVEEDILNYLKTGAEAKGAKPAKRVPLTPMRKIIASRMAKSKSEAPHFYITTEIDMSKCMAMREEINKGGAKVSYNDFFARAVALSMVENRTVNSVWHEDSIEERDEINIGIAVALSDGLIVPVIRNVDKKGLKEIAKDSTSLIEKARNNKLTPDEYQGGTFTISNLGTFDIDNFIAIVNPGESAILAIGKIGMRPVVRDGKIEVRPVCKVTLSCDHRVLDGAIAGKFLQRVKELMESAGDGSIFTK